jgi:hypothetical protein
MAPKIAPRIWGGLTQDEMMKRFEKTSLPDWALTILKKQGIEFIYLFYNKYINTIAKIYNEPH